MTEKTITMPELAKLYQAMTDQMRQQLARLREPGNLRAMNSLSAADLDAAQQALATAEQQRETALKNWDDRIAQLRERVDRLRLQAKAIEAQAAAGASKGKAKAPAGAAAAAKAKALAARKPKALR